MADRRRNDQAAYDRAYAKAKAQIDREVPVPCQYGNCTLSVDSLTGRITGGSGPVGCPCDSTPGWRSSRVQGMGKPHPPVLPKGRHANRVRRARRRHAIPAWMVVGGSVWDDDDEGDDCG